jgi:hypothetical protein
MKRKKILAPRFPLSGEGADRLPKAERPSWVILPVVIRDSVVPLASCNSRVDSARTLLKPDWLRDGPMPRTATRVSPVASAQDAPSFVNAMPLPAAAESVKDS